MILFLRLIKESVLFAYHSIKVNRLRTFLTLFGITIGIFAIISVFSVIDSFEKQIRQSISSLGDDVIYIQKWPWAFGGDEYPWWKYLKRPIPKVEEYEYLKKTSQKASAMAYMAFTSKNVKYENNSINNCQILIVTHDYQQLKSFELQNGRYFSVFESNHGRNVCIIGDEVASKLFENKNPVGQNIKFLGRKFTVIGVIQREGKDVIGGMSPDNVIIIPVNYAKTLIDLRNDGVGPLIMVRPKPGISIDEMKNELKILLRSYRRIKPLEEDNFALNQASVITQGFEQVFKVIDIAGWIIGGFSILVGGFGIANIMFVSVKERTKIIGIQKSLGAKNYFILFQFLFEAVLLAVAGGTIGLLLIFILTLIASNFIDFKIVLSFGNIIMGILISAVIGIISGFAPAYSAARLNPVEAINSHF